MSFSLWVLLFFSCYWGEYMSTVFANSPQMNPQESISVALLMSPTPDVLPKPIDCQRKYLYSLHRQQNTALEQALTKNKQRGTIFAFIFKCMLLFCSYISQPVRGQKQHHMTYVTNHCPILQWDLCGQPPPPHPPCKAPLKSRQRSLRGWNPTW